MPHIDAATRRAIRNGAIAAARVLGPLLYALWAPPPAAVVDVGCGEGWLGRALAARGATVLGVDGDDVGADLLADLAAPPYPDLGRRFDLAACLEVGEHVPESAAADLVAWLCHLSDRVAFSAAVPGQGGPGHVNEQPAEWWAEHFAGHGYAGSGGLRARIWDDRTVPWWYRQNLLVFCADPADLAAADLTRDGCPTIEHPEMLAWHGR